MRWWGWLVMVGCAGQVADVDDTNDTEGSPSSSTATTMTTGGKTSSPSTSTTEDHEISWRLHDRIGSLVYVSWTQAEAGDSALEFRFGTEDWKRTPTREYGVGEQEELLLGVPFETVAEVRRVSFGEGGEQTGASLEVTTGQLPPGLPLPTLRAYEAAEAEPTGTYLLSSINSSNGGWTSGQYWMFILDRQARVLWAHPGEGDDYTIYVQPSLDGDILWDVSTFWSDWDEGAGSLIHRMKIDGTFVETLAAPGMHHCFLELPDRAILYGAADWSTEVLRRIETNGDRSTIWDCEDFLYVSAGDWCHTNSFFYRESTNSLLMSFPTDDSFVVDLDLGTGEVMNWWGHIDGAWEFDPPDDAFWYQHGVSYTEEGTLLVSSHTHDRTDEGMVKEYVLDEDAQVLRYLWGFGEGDGIDADNAGEAHRLPSGNTLHNTGTTPRIREITPDDQVVWDVSWEGSKLMGRMTFLEDLYFLAP